MADKGTGIDALRRRIDEIDAAMHKLLMERGEMIAGIQKAKGVAGGGTSAMRPAREAQMLRALAERHAGQFPMASAERIWREIIGSFTQLQAPFRVVMTGAEPAVMMEYARHYFSVTTPLEVTGTANEIIAAIDERSDVVGLVLDDLEDAAAEPWWVVLARDKNTPARLVARFPFLLDALTADVSQRPAFMLSRAPVEPSGNDVTVVSVPVKPGLDARGARTAIEIAFVEAQLGGLSLRLAAQHDTAQGGLALVEILGHVPAALFDEADTGLRWLGGYAVPLDLTARKGARPS